MMSTHLSFLSCRLLRIRNTLPLHHHGRLRSRYIFPPPASKFGRQFSLKMSPSTNNTSAHRVKIPQMKLSWTLAELYNSPSPSSKKPVLVATCPSSTVDFSPDFKRSTKFVWQDAAVNNPPEKENLCHPLDVKYSLVAQRFGFTAGNMPVVIIGGAEEKSLHDNLEQIAEEQRPDIRFYDRPDQVVIKENEALAETLPIDALEGMEHVIPAEDHYRLLSKRDLAVSGLPTPKSKVLDVDITPDDTNNGFQKQISYVIESIKQQHPPFVIKFQQSLSGEGTFLVPDSKSQKGLLEHFTNDDVLKTLFGQVNDSNRHLLPASIIISEYVAGPHVKMHGLSFFIKPDGKTVFLCSGEQDMDDSNHWAGARMLYPDQNRLEKMLSPVMKQIGNYLFQNGYYGPVGADILHDTKVDSFVIVDLNVRCSGSLILGALKGSFEEKGYTEAYLLTSVKFTCTRAEFLNQFEKEVEQGKVVIVGWLEAKEEEGDWGSLAVAAEDHEGVMKLVERIEGLGVEGDAED